VSTSPALPITPSPLPLIIVGGGLAGSLAALALARARPELPLLLLEAGRHFGGNHTWSFFDGDVPRASRPWLDALQPWRNSHHRVRFGQRDRVIDQGYNSVESHHLDALVRARLAPEQWRCDCPVVRIEPELVVLADGSEIRASSVIDARGPGGAMPGLELGWQKFVGIEFSGEHRQGDCVTIMDANVPQIDGYRFVYTLPLARDRVLVEDTYYSDSPVLDVDVVTGRARAAAVAQGIVGDEVRHEQGVLPITIGGDPEVFWPKSDPVARLGLRGGFFHATTGYSFPLALAVALELAERADLSAPALAQWSRQRFLAHWRSSGWYRMLNRLMFSAAEPDQRYRIFARFYGLPEPLIARFYSGDLTLIDKARLISGRPPVPLATALRVLFLPPRPAPSLLMPTGS
jgi:lycopene beta-cyclase